jgi:hypothetical protein
MGLPVVAVMSSLLISRKVGQKSGYEEQGWSRKCGGGPRKVIEA